MLAVITRHRSMAPGSFRREELNRASTLQLKGTNIGCYIHDCLFLLYIACFAFFHCYPLATLQQINT